MKKNVLLLGSTGLLLLAMAFTVLAGESELQSYLPVYYNPPPTPTVMPTPTPQPSLLNGNFEAGHSGWQEYSALGYPIIMNNSQLPDALDPHSGQWATWFGGDYDEVSAIEQSVFVPPNVRTLQYYRWIASQDICNPDYDIAGVIMDDDGTVTESDVVDAFILCDGTSTNGWQGRSVDISRFAGKQVLLTIIAFTDGSLLSNMFVDDVSLSGNAPLGTEENELAFGEIPLVRLQRQSPEDGERASGHPASAALQERVLRGWLVERVEGIETR